MVDSAAAKAELRATVRRMRGQADASVLAAASRRVVDLLADVRALQQARTVLVHEARPGDLDPTALVDRLGDRGVRVLRVPRDGDEPTVVAAGRGHLSGADDSVDLLDVVDVVVVPGVAFDLDGGWLADEDDPWGALVERIDRDVPRIGLARTAQLVPRVPRDPGDHVVDVVVTDRAVHHTGARARPRDA